MQIYIHRNNEQLGPFTEDEIKAQLAAGTASLLDHVWWQGQQGWVPLGESALMAAGVTAAPTIPTASSSGGAPPPTSKLAVWALVCGCLGFLCGIFASIPAIILGHMGLTETKKNPGVQGRGMAMAGMILGYFVTALVIAYLILVFVVFASMGNQVKNVFKTINAQLKAAQITNSADQSATPPDQTTNAPDQTAPAPTPAPNPTPDQSTNSAPATPASPDSSTNSPAASTNAPDSSTNAAPMSQ